MLIERLAVPANHQLSLLPEIYVERGDKSDWDLLHELHYKSGALPIGPVYYKCVMRGKTIGVGIMAVPTMLNSGRNQLFPHLRPNTGGHDTRLINRTRALWINDHMCTNSRLVLDTMYRGAGIAYRMQNLMMRMSGCAEIEFRSSMSKFNPFASKAGVKFVKPARSQNYEKGLMWFRRWFDTTPTDYVGVMAELEAMSPASQAKCILEMRKFYYDFSSMEKSGDNRMNGTSRVDVMPVSKLLKNLQQLVFASPLYGVYVNPDYDKQSDCARVLPQRLPLLAFDNQPVDAPLNLSRLP